MRENGRSGSDGVEQEPAYCQAKWNGMKGNSARMTSHLTSARPPYPSLLFTSYPTIPEINRCVCAETDRRAMKKSAAFHASCHRRSSAAGRKREAEQAARMSPSR